jgi:hypothetical protein
MTTMMVSNAAQIAGEIYERFGIRATVGCLVAGQAGGGKGFATNLWDRYWRCGGKGRGRDVRHAPGPCSRRPDLDL